VELCSLIRLDDGSNPQPKIVAFKITITTVNKYTLAMKFLNEHIAVTCRSPIWHWTVWRVPLQIAEQSGVFTPVTFSSHMASLENEPSGFGIH
jgi:hypothetical protein